jgi:hypothetical protein
MTVEPSFYASIHFEPMSEIAHSTPARISGSSGQELTMGGVGRDLGRFFLILNFIPVFGRLRRHISTPFNSDGAE